MDIQLADIPDVDRAWETEHRVRALKINGKSPALTALEQWKKQSPTDYRKILKAIKWAAGQKRVCQEKHVKKISRYNNIYELRAHKGAARLLFFYSSISDDLIICTNSYWKTKSSSREQEQSFARCETLKNIYESEMAARHKRALR